MTDKKLTATFEYCVTQENCNHCPMHDNCPTNYELQKRVLDLINRLKAENKNCGVKIQNQREQLKACNEKIKEQQAEIERLKEYPKCVYEYDGDIVDYCLKSPCANYKTAEEIKTEAVKEFAERLKENTSEIVIGGVYKYKVITVQGIEHFLKEMG